MSQKPVIIEDKSSFSYEKNTNNDEDKKGETITPKQNQDVPARRKTLKEICADTDKRMAENKRPLY